VPKSGAIIRPARINVEVLAPIATADWTRENIHQHVDEIRQMYLKKLGQTNDEEVKLRSVK